MIPIADRDDITYGVLEANDVDDMADLLGETFSAGEPMAVAAGFRREDLAAMVRVYGPAAVEQQVTIVARDRNGDMAGALLTDDFGVPPPDGLQAFTQFAPVGAVLESLDARYREGRSIPAHECLHLAMIGVAERYAGRGIAQRLVETCLGHGARLGYTTAITEATGSVSQRVFRKLGFRDRFTVLYRDFRFEGRAVFAGIQSSQGTILMERRISIESV